MTPVLWNEKIEEPLGEALPAAAVRELAGLLLPTAAVQRLKALTRRHSVCLKAAACQFPLTHPV